jgi:hypothetical protein
VQLLLHKLPWFHLCTLLDKLKDPVQRDWYVRASIRYGWSRSVLVMQIETNAHKRLGQALTHFELHSGDWQKVQLRGRDAELADFKDEKGFEQIARALGVERPRKLRTGSVLSGS